MNDLENGKIRPEYKDARIHFVLVCAAKGCPKIASFAYFPGKLDQQLDAQTKKAMDDTYFIRVNKGDKKVEVSKIFEWYKEDFTNSGKTILEYVNAYRSEKIPADYAVSQYEYDWQLNVKKK